VNRNVGEACKQCAVAARLLPPPLSRAELLAEKYHGNVTIPVASQHNYGASDQHQSETRRQHTWIVKRSEMAALTDLVRSSLKLRDQGCAN